VSGNFGRNRIIALVTGAMLLAAACGGGGGIAPTRYPALPTHAADAFNGEGCSRTRVVQPVTQQAQGA
jgi:hypothetical protein